VRASVIIAAYRAERWIEACLDAWDAVEVPDGWTLDVRIGVDGCHRTADLLHFLGIHYWWSGKNVGTYLIRNSLIARVKADAYVIFDADDMPHADYLTELLPMTSDGSIAGAARRSIDETGKEISAHYPYANGVCVIPSDTWDQLGGYRSWRVAADHDLIQRAKAMGIRVRKHRSALYTRRVHPDSLTRSEDVGLRSRHRRRRKTETRTLVRQARRNPELLRVDPETVELHP
jgi:glycosyltransferase involved in cell wall biosynthesis